MLPSQVIKKPALVMQSNVIIIMFEKLEADQEKAMAQEGSLICKYKWVFFLFRVDKPLCQGARAKRRPKTVIKHHESSRSVTYLRVESYIYL